MSCCKLFKQFALILLCAALISSAQASDNSNERYQSNAFTSPYAKASYNLVVQGTEGFEMVGENDNLILYVDPTSLAVRALDKQTGHLWSSNYDDYSQEKLNTRWRGYANSGIVIEYYEFKEKFTDIKTKEENIFTKDSTAVTAVPIENGMHATVFFGEAEITISYDILLDDDGFRFVLRDEDIIEETNKKLVSVTFTPFLGSTKQGQSGYYLLPDGDGALVNFNKSYPTITTQYQKNYFSADPGIAPDSTYSGNYYDSPPLNYPVYGIVHGVENNGLMVDIREGETHAELLVYPAGVRTDFYFLTNRYIYRQVYTHLVSEQKKSTLITTERSHFNIEEHVTLLSGDEATYSGIARAYRKLLDSQGLLPSGTSQGTGLTLSLDVYMAAAQEGVFSNNAQMMTTLADVQAMVSELDGLGVETMLVTLRNALNSCISFSESDRYKLTSGIGSNAQLKETAEKLANAGHILALYLSEDYVRTGTADIDLQEDIIRRLNKQHRIYTDRYGAASSRIYQLNAFGFEKLVAQDAKKVQALGVNRLEIYLPRASSSYNKTMLMREESLDLIASALLAANENNPGLTYSVEQANSHPAYYAAMDAMTFIKMRTTLYPYISDTVPFTSLLLHGTMDLVTEAYNDASDPDEMLLRMIEWGVSPHFNLTMKDTSLLLYTNYSWLVSSQYANWRDTIIDVYGKVNDALGGLNGQAMINHQVLVPGGVLTTYETGTRILINYTQNDYTYQQVTVSARSYEVIV